MDQLRNKTVAYFYDEEYGNHSLGGCNPMRPHRVRLTNNLLEGYDIIKKMVVHRPQKLKYNELNEFHADEYLEFLSKVTPGSQDEYAKQMRRFNLGPVGEADCPVFDGMFDYCRIYAGGSRDGATRLMEGGCDIAFNWSGGMHHAKKAEASGFCYVNDIVLAILELLKKYHRVLYVDIDIHHGDGVEEAFYLTDRVMTVSFHNYGDFFPGTGAVEDTGYAGGANYSVNVPLREGMDDASYEFIYVPVMKKVMEAFQPEAIVVCAGADSLSGDRLGCFNLSLQGHSACVEFLASYNVPLLLLGGGGYTMRNVSRCWAYETARLQGIDLPDELPEHALSRYNYFMDTRRLRIEVSNMMNSNTREGLTQLRDKVLQQLSQLPPPSGAAISRQPAPARLPDAPEEDPDVRGGGQVHDELRRVKDGYDSDEEWQAGRAREQAPASGATAAPMAKAEPAYGAATPVAMPPAATAAAAAPASTPTAPMPVHGGGINGGAAEAARQRAAQHAGHQAHAPQPTQPAVAHGHNGADTCAAVPHAGGAAEQPAAYAGAVPKKEPQAGGDGTAEMQE